MKTTISSLCLYLLYAQVCAQDVNSILATANRRGNEGAYVSKIQALTEAIGILPVSKRPPVFNDRGTTYQKISNHELAVNDFNEAIKLDNENPLYYLNRANSYYILEQWENALYDYTKCLEIEAKNLDGLVGRARTYLKLNRNRKALDDCETTIKLYPSNPKSGIAFSIRGLIKTQELHTQDGLKDLKAAIELNPEDAEAFFNLGTYYQRVAKSDFSQLEMAAEAYSSAIHLNPQYIQAYFERAMVRLQRGNEKEAKNDVNRIIQTSQMGGRRFYKAYALRALLSYNLSDTRTYEADLNF